jgi:hypothetical protein
MITVACVRTGTKYGPEYVERLRNMVERHAGGREVRFVCLTDQIGHVDCIESLDVSALDLPGWWAKMALFLPRARDGEADRVVYLDLDTVLVDDIGPLLDYDGPFAICHNFTTLAGHPNWSRYGSCVMSFPAGWGAHVWHAFNADRFAAMKEAGNRGDQEAVALFCPHATYLQDVLPPGFFLHYKNIGPVKPAGCSAVIFGGNRTPANCPVEWIKGEWK